MSADTTHMGTLAPVLLASLLANAPPAPRAADECPELQRPAPFDKASAMLAVFCAYDTEHEGILLPLEYTEDWDLDEAETVVSPILAMRYQEGAAEKAVLAVQQQALFDGEISVAHAQTATISIYVFQRSNGRWAIEKRAEEALDEGHDGEAPPVQLVKLGPERFGLWFFGFDLHQGYSSQSAFIVTLSEPRIREVVRLNLGEDNAGTCSDDPKERADGIHTCWPTKASPLHRREGRGILHAACVVHRHRSRRAAEQSHPQEEFRGVPDEGRRRVRRSRRSEVRVLQGPPGRRGVPRRRRAAQAVESFCAATPPEHMTVMALPTLSRRSICAALVTCLPVAMLLWSALLLASAPPLQLLPIDEASQRPDFFSFRAHLQAAVARHDVDAVLAIVHPTIKNSFGGDDGLEGFRRLWRPAESDSTLWTELGMVLALGGTFDAEDSFTAPYVFSKWPNQIDSFEHVVLIASDVRIREAPRADAATLTSLSFAILPVPRQPGLAEEEGWTPVEIDGGKVGYVSSRLARSPIDYRARFSKIAGRWQLVFFLAGD